MRLASNLVFVALAPVFLITASVAWAFNDPGLYRRGFDKYNVSAVTGIAETDLEEVGAGLRRYFNSREEPLRIRARGLRRGAGSFSTGGKSCTCAT